VSLAPHLDPVVVDLGRRALLDMGEVSRSLVYGSFLTDDGFEVVHVPDGKVDANRFASMASSIQALSEAVAREVRIGSSEYVIIASDKGHVIQLRVPGHPVVLGALFGDDETLGKALSVARRCAQQLAASLADRPAVQPAAAAHEPDAAVEHGDAPARADAYGVPAL
jgi:predicted regulator of Ras-like GTPase activity (Roadblock/LC7/MglB family)